MCSHNKVEVDTGRLAEVFGEATRLIDRRLAPLMRELWARGIFAEDGCEQRWPGLACLSFAGTIDVEDFLEVAGGRFHPSGYKVDVETFFDDEYEEGDEDGDDTEGDGDEPQAAPAAGAGRGRRFVVDLHVTIPVQDLAGLARLFAAQPLPPERGPDTHRRWGPRNN
jgi:hypothetical protein